MHVLWMKVRKTVLVCPFVDGQVAFGALEVSRGLLEGVFIRSLGVLLLDFEELLNGRGSGDFFARLAYQVSCRARVPRG